MASDGLSNVLALRKVGVDAELLINSVDFCCAYPEWEYGYFGRDISVNGKDAILDPNKLFPSQLHDSWQRPSWIKELPIHFTFTPFRRFNRSLGGHGVFEKVSSKLLHPKLLTVMGFALRHMQILPHIMHYDIVETHVPYSLHLQWSTKPYVIYEAGWIRYIPYEKHLRRSRMAVESYQHAEHIIYTNPDMYDIFQDTKIVPMDKLTFIPFAIDTDYYKPQPVEDIRSQLAPNNEFLILMMSRQWFKEKANDKLLRAFYRFNKQYPNSKLILMAWGDDMAKSKQIINNLSMNHAVVWLPMMPKSKLILIYNAVNVACDQFVLGSWGCSFPEAMSCGTPTLMYWNARHIFREFQTLPPMPSVYDEDEILHELIKLYNQDLTDLNGNCRAWVKQTHGMELVGHKHKKVLEEYA